MTLSSEPTPTATLPARDLVASLAFFAQLGFRVELATTTRGYAAWGDITLQIKAHSDGPVAPATVAIPASDCRRLYDAFVKAGHPQSRAPRTGDLMPTRHRKPSAWISPFDEATGFEVADLDRNVLRFRPVAPADASGRLRQP